MNPVEPAAVDERSYLRAVRLDLIEESALRASQLGILSQEEPADLLLMIDEIRAARALATIEHNARPKPPVYPEMVDGQHVKQPIPFVLVEVSPSGFCEGLTYGPLRYENSRLVRYVLAPPEMPDAQPGGG
jgi:hypothetical protein